MDNPDFGITAEWIQLVKNAEEWRAEPYLDPVGLPTIGWGHRVPSLDVPRISPEIGEMLLEEDLRIARDHAVALSPILSTSERRCAAISDFCFNVGPAKYETSTLKKRVDEGLWSEAAQQNDLWVHGGGPILPGLVKRRAVTSAWLKEG
jgi:lysozyme